MKVLITLFVLAVLGLMWLRHENGNLSRSFETANRVASEQKATIGMLKISSVSPASSPDVMNPRRWHCANSSQRQAQKQTAASRQ